MSEVATIHFDAGVLRLPANDPYERELLFEQANFYARRHGTVRVQFDDGKMRVARSTSKAGMGCACCHHALRAVSVQVGERLFCIHCAKQAAACGVPALGPPH